MSVLKLTAALVLVAAPAAADPVDSATSSHLDRKDIDRRPHLRPIDLVRHLPGLYAILVAGGGQTPQLMLRGTDAGQGQDVLVLVDDVPQNAPGHAAGHGYADLESVIPDTVASIDLHEGSYDARWGDFANAGVLELHTLDGLPDGGAIVRMASGSEITGPRNDRRWRRLLYYLTGMASPKLARGQALLAAEVGIADGPYVNPQRMRRGLVTGSWTTPVGERGELRASARYFESRWADSGVLPDDEIEAGRLGPYSAADITQGGVAARAQASLALTIHDRAGAAWHVAGWIARSNDRFYTDPTLYYRDPDAGDEVEEVDARTAYGVSGWWTRGALRIGAEARGDDFETSLWHDERRHRLTDCFAVMNPCTDTDDHVRDVGVYGEGRWTLGDRVAITPGIRLDELTWDGQDLDPETATTPDALTGNDARARISPKLGVDIAASDDLDVLARVGGGFRSVDPHAAIAYDGVRAIPRTVSGEIGVQAHPDPVRAALVGWSEWMDRQVGWSPIGGDPVQVPAIVRYGLEATVRAEPTTWLAFDAGASIARATQFVTGMPSVLGGGGVSLTRRASSLSLRVVGIGARAFSPALVTPAAVVCSLLAHTTWRRFGFDLDVENLLDASWREEASAGPVRPSHFVDGYEDVRFSPGAPLTALLSISYATP